MPPPLPLPLLPFLFLSILLPTSIFAGDVEGYTACAPFACGDFGEIGYPFWSNNQPDYCGHPKFNLDCKPDEAAIDIMSQKFHVIEINQTSQILKIAKFDLWSSNLCPNEYTNVSLDFDFFNYTSNDDNITLAYGCNPYFYAPPPVELNSSSTINCKENGDPQVVYVVLGGNSVDLSDLGCEFVTVPVLSSAKGALEAGYEMDKGFDSFEVRWSGVNGDRCDGCAQSGGRCGHNASTNEFLCFCRDNQKPYGGICGISPAQTPLPARSLLPTPTPTPSETLSAPSVPGHHPLNWKAILGIGVGAAVFVALAAIIAIYCYRRQKKTADYEVSYIQSRSLSSDPSSVIRDTEKGVSQYFGVPLFTYTELEEATNHFDSSRELGDGGFGTVYFGKLQDGRCVAVKRLYENNYRRVEQFRNEIQLLAGLRHPNLVSLYGCTSRHSRELLLVYEYISNGTIADHLHGERARAGTLPWHIRMKIAVETATALMYLHAKDIIHRDVKTNNILLDSHFVVKVADFGLSRLFPNNVTHISTAPQGTPGYVDPEYHECYQLTDKSDVYSFGVVLIELISSLPAVDITRHRHEINLSNMAINKIQNQALHELVDRDIGFESDFKVRKMVNAVAELAFQCLQSSKDMRPSMGEVVDTLKDIQSDGKHKSQPEVMDITGDDVVLLKDDPPPPSPDSNAVSKSTTPNASG